MTDPDVRVVVQGLQAAERKIEQLHRQRRRVDRMAEEARRTLVKIDRELKHLERVLRRESEGDRLQR